MDGVPAQRLFSHNLHPELLCVILSFNRETEWIIYPGSPVLSHPAWYQDGESEIERHPGEYISTHTHCDACLQLQLESHLHHSYMRHFQIHLFELTGINWHINICNLHMNECVMVS